MGNGEKARDAVEAKAGIEEPVPQARAPAIISHKAGDEKNQAFWHALVSTDPQTLVAKATAIFAIRNILLELQGLKAHRTEIDFRGDPVTLDDLFALLEKLSGPSGWQLLQRKAGF